MQGYSVHFVCFDAGWLDSAAERHVCGERGGRVMEPCEKDLLAHISVPDLLHNRSGKASSGVVLKSRS